MDRIQHKWLKMDIYLSEKSADKCELYDDNMILVAHIFAGGVLL